MANARIIIAGDVLALMAFALIGLASHEHEVTLAVLARTFLPFAFAWLLIGGVSGMFRPDAAHRPRLGVAFLFAYLVAGVLALLARSLVFDRTLLNAFFVIALVGNGLFLFGWRATYGWWLARRSSHLSIKEATRS
jgi:hypothetical protein